MLDPPVPELELVVALEPPVPVEALLLVVLPLPALPPLPLDVLVPDEPHAAMTPKSSNPRNRVRVINL
jgi:hypothetical protein